MATTKYILRQGESKVLEIPVLDENGQAVDISTSATTNIIVTLSNKGVVFSKYSLQDMGSDFGDIDRTGNTIQILAERNETKFWNTGYALATVTIENDDPALTHAVKDFEVPDFIQILTSTNKDIVLPH